MGTNTPAVPVNAPVAGMINLKEEEDRLCRNMPFLQPVRNDIALLLFVKHRFVTPRIPWDKAKGLLSLRQLTEADVEAAMERISQAMDVRLDALVDEFNAATAPTPNPEKLPVADNSKPLRPVVKARLGLEQQEHEKMMKVGRDAIEWSNQMATMFNLPPVDPSLLNADTTPKAVAKPKRQFWQKAASLVLTATDEPQPEPAPALDQPSWLTPGVLALDNADVIAITTILNSISAYGDPATTKAILAENGQDEAFLNDLRVRVVRLASEQLTQSNKILANVQADFNRWDTELCGMEEIAGDMAEVTDYLPH